MNNTNNMSAEVSQHLSQYLNSYITDMASPVHNGASWNWFSVNLFVGGAALTTYHGAKIAYRGIELTKRAVETAFALIAVTLTFGCHAESRNNLGMRVTLLKSSLLRQIEGVIQIAIHLLGVTASLFPSTIGIRLEKLALDIDHRSDLADFQLEEGLKKGDHPPVYDAVAVVA